jgi:hypothetical protein
MPEYREVSQTIEVPRGAGIAGFLKTIEKILRQSRVQEVSINARGHVSYRRFARSDEDDHQIQMEFDSLMPWAVIRNGEIEELNPLDANAAVVVSQMFSASTRDHLHPVAWASRRETPFWEWHGKTTGVVLGGKEEAYGIPFYTDDGIPDDSLVLCSAYGRDATLVDTKKAYKITIPFGVRRMT